MTDKPDPQYWLMKSEPDTYGIDDLERDVTEHWDGIRNYQARNFMRDDMRIGDWVLFYHSNTKPPGVAGIAQVCSEPYPDHTQFDPDSKYHDPKSDPDNPRWMMVDVKYRETLPRYVSLQEIKDHPALQDMLVVKRGQRLSIQPVTRQDFRTVAAEGGSSLLDEI